MELKLYNTITRKKEIFKPIKKGEVKIYVCGPTVNDVPHLGHARQQITFDVLRKVLIYNGFKVKFVSNVTDVEDKIIIKANESGEDIKELTERNLKVHVEDYAALGVDKPDVRPRATEYIKEMIKLVELLEKKGYTYEIEGDGIYYDISKFRKYGKLSHQKVEKLKSGARVKIKEEKRNKEDFVLWKFSKEGEPAWDSPWGKGRPGWHIECSAMSELILGLPLDIHGGGQDLIFPHHEDEIAQSEAAFGKELAKYWIHNGMVNIDSIKMSKSLGNFRTIRDLLSNYSGKVIRYFVFNTHYRKPLNFSLENLDAAKSAYEKLERKVIELKKIKLEGRDFTKKYSEKFLDAINDDLNMPRSLEVVWNILNDLNFDSFSKLKLLEKFDFVLGFDIKNMKEEKFKVSAEVAKLIHEREKLRKEKKFAEADILRERIKEEGYLLEDTSEGAKVRKI